MKLIFICALTAMALLVGGCGGSDNPTGATETTSQDPAGAERVAETTPEAPPLSKKAFLKRADAICDRGGEKIRREIQRNKVEYGLQDGNPTNKEREKAILDLVIPTLAQQTGEIAALGVPKGDEDEVAAIVAALEKGVTETEADASLAIEGPNPFNEASQLSKKYGLKKCR